MPPHTCNQPHYVCIRFPQVSWLKAEGQQQLQLKQRLAAILQQTSVTQQPDQTVVTAHSQQHASQNPRHCSSQQQQCKEQCRQQPLPVSLQQDTTTGVSILAAAIAAVEQKQYHARSTVAVYGSCKAYIGKQLAAVSPLGINIRWSTYNRQKQTNCGGQWRRGAMNSNCNSSCSNHFCWNNS